MARYPFSLYKRRRSGATDYSYYVQFWNPETSSYSSGRSVERLREDLDLDPELYSPKKKSDARLIVEAWISKTGNRRTIKEPRLGEYCLDFWDWNASTYIRSIRLRGKTIGKEYVSNNYSYIKRYICSKPLGDIHLSKVTPAAIESFILDIKASTTLSNTSCNAILCAIGKPLAEAFRLGLINENPLTRVAKLQKDTAPKGILTSKEISALFSTDWDDDRVRIAAMLALSCGLRLGEILGLQNTALIDDRLIITGAYGKEEGLKTTKNGKSRIVPLPFLLKSELGKLLTRNPHNESWIFWSEKPGVPIHFKTIEKAFYNQLTKIGIKDMPLGEGGQPHPGSRQARNITFHSLRHLYNTLLRGAIPDELLRECTGHLSASMTEHYDHAEHDIRLKKTSEAVESRIMPLIEGEKALRERDLTERG
jgi:integrase